MNRILSGVAMVSLCAGLAGYANFAQADEAPDAASASATPSVNLDDELAKAHALRLQGNYDDATRLLAQLILFAPTDGRVVGEYGKVLAQEGQSKDAVQFLQHAISLQGDDWTFYSALGVAYDQLDDRADARAAYEHALAMKPGESTVLNNLAVSRMLAGDLDGAQQYLQQAQASGGSNPKVASNLQTLARMRAARGSAVTAQNTAPKHITVRQKPASQTAIASAPPKSLMPAPVEAKELSQPAPQPTAIASIAKEPPTVIMQQVPEDPLAGPVRAATHAPRKLVVADKPKTAKTVVAKSIPRKTLALTSHAPQLRASTDDLRPSPAQQ